LGVAALEWQTMRGLRALQPDAWHLAYQQRVAGDWFDQRNAGFFSSEYGTVRAKFVTLVALVVGALRATAQDAGQA
jgi:hypothetical protein